MPSAPDYSLYVDFKRKSTSQAVNSREQGIFKNSGYTYGVYLPLYRSVGFPANALRSNKFTFGSGGGAMPAAAFTPSDLATPTFMWFDGAVAGSITTSGSNVTAWADQSGNSRNLVITGGGPATVGTLNGMSTINCNNAVLGTSVNVPFPRFFSSFIVFNTTNHVFFSQWDGSYAFYFYTINAPLLEVPGGNNAWDGVSPNTSPISLANSWKFMTFAYNGLTGGSGAPFSIDGTQRTIWGNPNTNTTNSRPFYLNGRGNAAITAMNIAEAIFYNSVLSLADSQKIEGYLAWKWGLEANLPVGHPYRAARPTK